MKATSILIPVLSLMLTGAAAVNGSPEDFATVELLNPRRPQTPPLARSPPRPLTNMFGLMPMAASGSPISRMTYSSTIRWRW